MQEVAYVYWNKDINVVKFSDARLFYFMQLYEIYAVRLRISCWFYDKLQYFHGLCAHNLLR